MMDQTGWIVFGICCGLFLLPPLVAARTALLSLDHYFLANRRLPWWMIAVSLWLCAYPPVTIPVIMETVRVKSLSGAWIWWATAPVSFFTALILMTLWNRSGVATEPQFCEYRYSGSLAVILRVIKAFIWGPLLGVAAMTLWHSGGFHKTVSAITGWNNDMAVLTALGLGLLSVLTAGFRGHGYSSVVTAGIFLISAVSLLFWTVKLSGGWDSLEALKSGGLGILPSGELSNGKDSVKWLMILLMGQWLIGPMSDAGSLAAQRIRGAKTSLDARAGFLLEPFLMLIGQIGILAVLAIFSLVLISSSAIEQANGYIDHQSVYYRLISLLPTSLWRGLALGAFVLAWASFAGGWIHHGALVMTQDLYKRFLMKSNNERHYLLIAMTSTLVMATLGVIFSLNARWSASLWMVMSGLTAGLGPVVLLRWFWWRVSAASELAAMVGSVAAALLGPKIFSIFHWPSSVEIQIAYLCLAPAVIWLPVTLFGPMTNQEKLRGFLDQVRPPGPGWQRIRRLEDSSSIDRILQERKFWRWKIALTGLASVGFYLILLGFLWWFTQFSRWWPFALAGGVLSWIFIVYKLGEINENRI